MTFATFQGLCYLASAVLFIVGLKGLAHPRTAVRGNMLAASGMGLAAIVTVINAGFGGWGWALIIVGVLIGTGIGIYLARTTQMTGMPQLVALFNGFGGAASFLVAGAVMHITLGRIPELPESEDVELLELARQQISDLIDAMLPFSNNFATAISGIIGAVTLSGSVLAFAKLQELIPGGANTDRRLKHLTGIALGLSILAGGILIIWPTAWWAYWLLVIAALVAGVTFVLPIGGADMPVVISLLNSFSGLAAAATGFVISNTVLIIAGTLVGASGLILTRIMCIAMNRTLDNVLFGVMAEAGSGGDADEVYGGKVKSTSADEIAMLLETARRVVIVPGYGMAVAQAQHAVRDFANLLEQKGTIVEYAIHPVAGRMPGHMNVLLAEADVPYDKLKEMDDVNREMAQVDVAIIIGANDTVNPAARDDPKSPIAGMPIINVDHAATVIVIKRSLSPGFAGIPNPLFAAPNTLMFFSDGKKAVVDLINAVKAG